MSTQTYAQLYPSDFLNKFGSKANEIGELTFCEDNPVIDLKKIAKILDLDVSERDLSVDGFFEKKDKNIVINQNVSEGRKRFTLAHEIGHSQLDIKSPDIAFRGAETYEDATQEYSANQFAAELLMPNKKLLIRLMQTSLKSFGANPSNFGHFERDLALSDVSSKMKVSAEALKYRLINLNVLRGS